VSRIPLVDPASPPDSVPDTVEELFEKVQARFGVVPDGVKVLANSPAAFAAWWEFQNAMQDSALVREKLAVMTASAGACGYTLAVHPAAGSAEERAGDAESTAAAALGFAAAIVQGRGAVPDTVIEAARAAGLTDAQLVEIAAVTTINTFTSVVNRLG
jgi:alkylhydroperoxidase family enzyme